MGMSIVILAAGKGVRMRSPLPKVLHKLAGKAMLEHVIQTASKLPHTKIFTVVGHQKEQVESALSHYPIHWVEQAERLGTGHAVLQVLPHLDETGQVLILAGDVPLIGHQTLEGLISSTPMDAVGLLTAQFDNPYGFGRIIRNDKGQVIEIVEEKDAIEAQKSIEEINTGIMLVPVQLLQQWLPMLSANNAQKEYYLTDIIRMAVEQGVMVETSQPACQEEVFGINSKQQLIALERYYQHKRAMELIEEGAYISDPQRFDCRGKLELGSDIAIDVNVIFEGDNVVGDNVTIGPNCFIKDSQIGNGVTILSNTVIEDAKIGTDCSIGPFARVRPGTQIDSHAKVGNFVELKKSHIGENSKVSHLSYVGDASLGRDVNVGAGMITCNYDGVNKHKTIIQDGAFIGSNTSLVAPIEVGKNATVAAGSTVSKQVEADCLTVGRARQKTIPNWQRPQKKDQT